jgi:hypothetical protein
MVLANFDPEVFLQSEFEEAPDTTRTLLPQAWIEVATIKDIEIVKPKLYTNDATGEKNWTSPVFIPHMVINDPDVREELNFSGDRELLFRPRFYLDLTSDGALDFGPNRNLRLGQLVAAVGLYTPGVQWSFPQFRGCKPFLIHVVHEASKNNPEMVFEQLREIRAKPEEV